MNTISPMDILEKIKTLSNETRLNILEWLKQPELHFAECHILRDGDFAGGVCVGTIADKTKLAQSVVSGYLAKMHKAGLLEAKRVGQWTYYRRNENGIQSLKNSFSDL